jgi:hypothetical protein
MLDGRVVEESSGSARHVRLSGTVHVAVEIARALELFTPRGESRWAHGWAPRFPAPVVDDGKPGTVFEVSHAGVASVWIVCAREPGRSIEYARFVPGRTAGTVRVSVEPAPQGAAAHVEYELTALTDAGARDINELAATYADYLDGWAEAIAARAG